MATTETTYREVATADKQFWVSVSPIEERTNAKGHFAMCVIREKPADFDGTFPTRFNRFMVWCQGTVPGGKPRDMFLPTKDLESGLAMVAAQLEKM